MKKLFYLSGCSTCARIMGELNLEGFELQDIRENNISGDELDMIAEYEGGYEKVFSKRAMKYKSMGLKDMALTEKDFRNYILDEYTFLKRPVIITNDKIFVGNAKKVVEAAKEHINT